MNRWGEDEARETAEGMLATALPRRWRHVRAVAAEAARLTDALNADRRTVVSAAWLHDIGYAPAIVDTGYHPLDGARYLRENGWDDQVCRLVAHHTDAARQADGEGLGDQLRAEFPAVEGIARDIVWTADVTTGPNGERMTLDERLSETALRYGPGHPVTKRMAASRDFLERAIARTTAAYD